MAAILRRNVAYRPGKPLFERTRPFIHPDQIPAALHANAYEMISGEPVNVAQVDSFNATIKGTFVDHTGARRSASWRDDGAPRGSRVAEFSRPLQIREDFLERYRAFVAGL